MYKKTEDIQNQEGTHLKPLGQEFNFPPTLSLKTSFLVLTLLAKFVSYFTEKIDNQNGPSINYHHHIHHHWQQCRSCHFSAQNPNVTPNCLKQEPKNDLQGLHHLGPNDISDLISTTLSPPATLPPYHFL